MRHYTVLISTAKIGLPSNGAETDKPHDIIHTQKKFVLVLNALPLTIPVAPPPRQPKMTRHVSFDCSGYDPSD